MPAAKKAKSLQVVAPLVQVKFGSQVLHYYAGDILPVGADEGSVENLKSLGYVSEVEVDNAPDADDN